MELENKEKRFPKKNILLGAAPWIVLMIVALIIIGSLIAIYYLWPKETPGTVTSEEEVRSYIGIITKIEKDSFVIKAESERNKLDQDGDFIVQVTKDTQYFNTVTPISVPAEDEDTGSSVQITQAAFSDLKVGDEVVVASSSDIAGKSQFTAARVEILDVTGIKSYMGEIKSIGNEQIEITAGAKDNYFSADTVLIAKTNPKTEYFQIYLVENASPAGDFEGQIERKKISFQEIKVGDKVVVSSSQDLTGQTTFFVREVSVLPKQ